MNRNGFNGMVILWELSPANISNTEYDGDMARCVVDMGNRSSSSSSRSRMQKHL